MDSERENISTRLSSSFLIVAKSWMQGVFDYVTTRLKAAKNRNNADSEMFLYDFYINFTEHSFTVQLKKESRIILRASS